MIYLPEYMKTDNFILSERIKSLKNSTRNQIIIFQREIFFTVKIQIYIKLFNLNYI